MIWENLLLLAEDEDGRLWMKVNEGTQQLSWAGLPMGGVDNFVTIKP